MKKLNLPLVATLALFGSLMFASCKKDHTCQCNVGISLFYDTTINFEIEDQTNKNARRLCENNESTLKTYTAALLGAALGSFPQDSTGMIPPITISPNMINATCELN